MNRRKFLKVMGAGAGATAFTVTTVGSHLIDALGAAQTATPTVSPIAPTANQVATQAAGNVPAPSGGLGSNSNYFLYSDCNPVTGLSVTVEITKDIISDIGFSIQLNCYSPQNANCVWQQYVMEIQTSDGSPLKIFAIVDNWPSDSLSQSLNLPTGSDLINSHGNLMLTLPGATLPAGYKFTISLEYDKDQNVNGARFLVVDNKGKATSKEIVLESLDVNHTNPPKPITSTDLAPINAFELNLVGPVNGKNSYLSAGAGTITYTASSPLTVLSKKPACCADQNVLTEEIANTVYGMLLAGPSQTITQSFDTDISHPYTPGIRFAVSQQFGIDQTDVFAIDSAGQLVVFTAQGNGHWHSSKPKSPPELVRPGAAIAASQHFGIQDQTDVFLVDIHGQLTVFSVAGAGDWNAPQTIGPKGFARSGAALAASQDFGTPDQTNVFVIDKNGQLNVFSVIGSGTWNGTQTIGPAGLAPSGAVVVASQQFGVPNQTDVFCINQTGVDGQGWPSVFWAGVSGGWKGPKALLTEA